MEEEGAKGQVARGRAKGASPAGSSRSNRYFFYPVQPLSHTATKVFLHHLTYQRVVPVPTAGTP